ncbi:flagellin N-terminal-like domain-containing protein [Natronoarchaeum philippinense]|uniref:Flagellin N-terminal-like domain-containing protein n=1 Tax=Natronoarchaeum philippinense TaxID=558529 RepID=A0A285MZM3_NATPI|nr:type IV pilin [Natronoarchaeum philippinense]SNZ02642.1 flagellin N-terminal-like domain-containing protein [Natronoarchaeum philippinense]
MNTDWSSDRGQSEVIGVVLIVGIVVLLSALAGLFIFDLSSNNLETAPQANFEVEQYGDQNQQVRLYHDGGDVITDTDAITVTVNGTEILNNQAAELVNDDGNIDAQTDVFFSTETSSGNIVAKNETIPNNTSYTGLDAGTPIKITWNPEDADNSAILFEYEVEDRS